MNELEKLAQGMNEKWEETGILGFFADRLTELSKTHALVPREPTPAMHGAHNKTKSQQWEANNWQYGGAYKATIAVAESGK